MWTTIIPVPAAARLVGRPGVRFLDCRHQLADPEHGPRAYAQGHVPGAVHAHVDRDLSSPILPTTGRHPLPEPARFRGAYGRWGIDEKVQVIAYDDQGGIWAARAWWLLHDYGHEAAAVLDGGLPAWLRAGHPIEATVPSIAATSFRGEPGHRPRIEATELWESLRKTPPRLLDARAPERFRGDVEPIDAVAGHIPGARNSPTASHLNADGTFKAPGALRDQFLKLLAERSVNDTVAYCGSGVTATHILLALEVAGLGVARLYPGSWSEWIRDPNRPVEKGVAGHHAR